MRYKKGKKKNLQIKKAAKLLTSSRPDRATVENTASTDCKSARIELTILVRMPIMAETRFSIAEVMPAILSVVKKLSIVFEIGQSFGSLFKVKIMDCIVGFDEESVADNKL